MSMNQNETIDRSILNNQNRNNNLSNATINIYKLEKIYMFVGLVPPPRNGVSGKNLVNS